MLGRNALGSNPLGVTTSSTYVTIERMYLELDFADVGSVTITELIPESLEFDTFMGKIFPEVTYGGYLFVEVDDDGDKYNLSFEGIETD